MEIAVIGTGYVGLVAGTCFSDMGHRVTCVDVIPEKIEALNRGEIPIYEPGLDHLVERNRREERLFFTTDVAKAVKAAKAVFIAVGTPPGEDGSADLRFVLAVAKSIGENIEKYTVVINKSTVPVGTGDKVYQTIKSVTDVEFDVVSNPEFLKEGAAIEDFLRPDRVVVGVENDKAKKVMEDIYLPFVRNGHPIFYMDVKSAEVTKYAANAMLATRISFMNEISNLCDAVGADVNWVRRGIGSDKRIGSSFLYSGIGYGGSCFPKDVQALLRTAREYKLNFNLLEEVEAINHRQKQLLVNRLFAQIGDDLKGKKVTLWGLAFKPETDDIREAPSLVIIKELLDAGAEVHVSDPEAMQEVKKVYGDKIHYHSNKYEAVDKASALLLITEWNEYRNPDFNKLKGLMLNPLILDGRNLYRETDAIKDFTYICIGANRR